jgi:GntR family transcriptional regulator
MRASGQSFLYLEVIGELRKRIVSGQYPVGATIPSLSSLVKSFGVSPITIRRALHELMFEGALYGRQGRGVFVADTRRIVRVLTSSVGWPLGNDIRRAGYDPTIEEISYGPIKPDPHLARRLKLRRETIYRHEKRILADNVPIALDVVHLSSKTATIMREHLKSTFVFALINTLKIPVTTVEFEISGTFATNHEVNLLGVMPHSPLIVASYILIDKRGDPVLEGYTAARADRMTFALATEVAIGAAKTANKKGLS